MVSTVDEVSRQFWCWAAGVSCVKVRARDVSLCERGRDILAPWADELPGKVRAQTVPAELPTPGWKAALLREIGNCFWTFVAPLRLSRGRRGTIVTTSHSVRSNGLFSVAPQRLQRMLEERGISWGALAPGYNGVADWGRPALARSGEKLCEDNALVACWRIPSPDEREWLHGLPAGYTATPGTTNWNHLRMMGKSCSVLAIEPLWTHT
eukprot:9913847-Alexandrium_andersonii.AAC.1